MQEINLKEITYDFEEFAKKLGYEGKLRDISFVYPTDKQFQANINLEENTILKVKIIVTDK